MDTLITHLYATKPSGVGIGVIIVRSIKEAYGGKLWSENIGDGGVAFLSLSFFFQAEDGIRDYKVTGVQTCALPIYLVAVGIAQVGAVVAIAVVRARAGRAFVAAAPGQAGGMGRVHRVGRRGHKGHHGAIARRGRLAVEGAVDIKARQCRRRRHPAQRGRPAIGLDGAALQSQREKHRVIEAAGPLEITGADGDVAEHGVNVTLSTNEIVSRHTHFFLAPTMLLPSPWTPRLSRIEASAAERLARAPARGIVERRAGGRGPPPAPPDPAAKA